MAYINEKAFEGTVLAHTDGGVPNLVLHVRDFSEESLRLPHLFLLKKPVQYRATCSASIPLTNPA